MNNLEHLELIVIRVYSNAKVERGVPLVHDFVAHEIDKIRHFWPALFNGNFTKIKNFTNFN